jgi:hypothetical protein
MYRCKSALCLLLLIVFERSFAQEDFTFRVEPGLPCVSLLPDTKVLFASTDTFLSVEPAAGTEIIDTLLSGATLRLRDGYLVLRPIPGQHQVKFSFIARSGDRGEAREITRTFRVVPLPSVSVGKVPCDSATDAMGLLLPGKLSVNAKLVDAVFSVDSFKVDIPGSSGMHTFEMKENRFSREFREAAMELPGGSLVMFYEVYGSWLKGIPVPLPGCNIYILDEIYPAKFSVGDED